MGDLRPIPLHRKRWAKKEEYLLRQMFREGKTDHEIAVVLSRTDKSVKARRHGLRLSRLSQPKQPTLFSKPPVEGKPIRRKVFKSEPQVGMIRRFIKWIY